jgi:hypothetical protein
MKMISYLLSVIYWLFVPIVLFLVFFGGQLIAMGRGSQDYVFLGGGLFVILFLIFGALEAGKEKQKRSYLEYALKFGPALMIIGFLIIIFF